jgi:signal peptidase
LLLDIAQTEERGFLYMKKENQSATPQNNEAGIVEEPSKGKKILNTVVNVILVIAIALAAVCTYVSYVSSSGNGVPSILGIRMFSIQTDSMYPVLLPGDLIFDTAVDDKSELRPGDIITYWTVINGERVLNTHTIYEIYDGSGYLIFATKGENNTSIDPLTVHESEIVGKYSFRVPGLGKVFDYLQTSTGFLIVVVVPVFLFFVYHLIQFFRVLFEYQNVKNRIKFEQERGNTEDLIAQQKKDHQAAQAQARAKMEEELRERLRAEILASMAAQKKETAEEAPAEEPAAEEAPAEEAPVEEAPVEEAPVEEAPVEEAPAEETPVEEAPVEETPVEETPAEEAPAEEAPAEEAPAEEKPVMDEAAIEALIAKQREAIEAELREKLRAEFMATMNQENKAEDTAE